jgi:7-carboxy-7-deazaguanine synthase
VNDGAESERELRISEIFRSVQGEGASAGAPCAFLRLAHCNLRCSFCDTTYAWDWQKYRIHAETRVLPLAELAEELRATGEARLVITGGEPLIQATALDGLLELLPPSFAIEIETNGTLAPSPRLLERVTQWNVSPKLANGGDPIERRLVPAVLATLRDTGRAFLKLVVGTAADATEATALLESLNWPKERVFFMPLAATRSELAARAPLVQVEALHRGVRYSPRLHVERWNGARGR